MDEAILVKLEEAIIKNPDLTFKELAEVMFGSNPPKNVVKKHGGYMRFLPSRNRVVQDVETGRWYPVTDQPVKPKVEKPQNTDAETGIDQLGFLGLHEVSANDVTLLPIFRGLMSKLRISTQYIEFNEAIAWIGENENPDSGKWTAISQIQGSNIYLSEDNPDFPAFQYRNLYLKLAVPKKPGSLNVRMVVYRLVRKNWKIWVGAL